MCALGSPSSSSTQNPYVLVHVEKMKLLLGEQKEIPKDKYEQTYPNQSFSFDLVAGSARALVSGTINAYGHKGI